jgi:hypothetical protein
VEAFLNSFRLLPRPGHIRKLAIKIIRAITAPDKFHGSMFPKTEHNKELL